MSLGLAAILGLVEGLTEFIPVSSTGHLILAGHLLNFTGEKASVFEVFIQLGAILSVIAAYPQRFAGFLNFNANEGFTGRRGLALLAVTTLPALFFGFLFHKIIKHYLFNPASVAFALIAGGIAIIVIERMNLQPKKSGLDSLSFKEGIGIGLFQCLAMWPGVSRSAATIFGGMALGLDRKTAAEYSFFAAVPVLCAAGLLDLIKSRDLLAASDLPFFGVGLIVSFITAWVVIKLFIGIVSRCGLTAFGIYRIFSGILVFLLIK